MISTDYMLNPSDMGNRQCQNIPVYQSYEPPHNVGPSVYNDNMSFNVTPSMPVPHDVGVSSYQSQFVSRSPMINQRGSSGFDRCDPVLEVLKQTQLPKIELSIFSGDPIDFQIYVFIRKKQTGT